MTTGVNKVLMRLKTLREQRSLSQGAVARSLGINRTTYVRKEGGHIPITTGEWLKLADLMGVEPGYFFLLPGKTEGEDGDVYGMTLLALYRSLRAMEQRDLLTLIVIAFKGIRRKKVREKIARLREGQWAKIPPAAEGAEMNAGE